MTRSWCGSHSLLLLFILFGSCSSVLRAPSTRSPGEVNIRISSSDEPITTTTPSGPILTGDPQKDYIHDPNLPRELRGFDLSKYPFYSRVPKPNLMNFTCDGLHDGFYASIPHECQVYHHCVLGVRFDFLCPNFTAFDQKIFNCHFASEVQCADSEKHFSRNLELYVWQTTTTAVPLRAIPPRQAFPARDRPAKPLRQQRPRQQRPQVQQDYYDYYDYYGDDYYSDYYNDYYDSPQSAERQRPQKNNRAPQNRRRINRPSGPTVIPNTKRSKDGRGSLFSGPRSAPRIKPPIPKNTPEWIAKTIPGVTLSKNEDTEVPAELTIQEAPIEENIVQEEPIIEKEQIRDTTFEPQIARKRNKIGFRRRNRRPGGLIRARTTTSTTTTTTTAAPPPQPDYDYAYDTAPRRRVPPRRMFRRFGPRRRGPNRSGPNRRRPRPRPQVFDYDYDYNIQEDETNQENPAPTTKAPPKIRTRRPPQIRTTTAPTTTTTPRPATTTRRTNKFRQSTPAVTDLLSAITFQEIDPKLLPPAFSDPPEPFAPEPVPVSADIYDTPLPANNQFWRPRNQVTEESRVVRRLPTGPRNNIPIIRKSVDDILHPRRHEQTEAPIVQAQPLDQHPASSTGQRFSDNRQFEDTFSEGITTRRRGGNRFTIADAKEPRIRLRQPDNVQRNGPQFIPEPSEAPVRAVHIPSTSFRRRHPTPAPFRFNSQTEAEFSELSIPSVDPQPALDELPLQQQFSQRGPSFLQSENPTSGRRFRGLLNANLRRPPRMAYPSYYTEYRLI